MVRILLDDGMQIPLGTGIGKYSEHLAGALSREPGVSVDVLDYQAHHCGRKSARLSYNCYINSPDFRRKAEGYDLCIFTNYAMPLKKLGIKTAVTVHDLAVYDYPETLPKAYVPYGRLMIENSVRKADAIITVSRVMERAISERYPHVATKVSYAWPGLYGHVGISDFDNPYEDKTLEEASKYPFFLMVGTIEKRKNIELVIEAFAKFKEKKEEEQDDFKLILAGRPGFGFKDIKAEACKCWCRESILFPGYVSDNDCGNLYRDAVAQVFPSIYEGFGSTQLESMAAGLPLMLSDIPTNREVAGGYGEFFQPDDVDDLARVMGRMGRLTAPQRELATKILVKADWEKVAKCYLGALS